MNGTITIISCGTESRNMAHGRTRLFAGADFLVAGRRLLDNYPDFNGEQVVLGADSAKTAERMCELAAAGHKVIVLASGDALFHGIGATFVRLRERYDNCFELNIEPAPTAFQSLFARLQMPWERAHFFSLHQGAEIPLREILAAPLAVVYGGSRITAAQAAAALLKYSPSTGTRRAVLAENIGYDDEKITTASLAEIAGLKCGPIAMLLLPETNLVAEEATMALGLEDSFYEPEKGLITSAEIRCVVLAKLRLPPRGILWDIGAGSGSVGLEAAALRPELEVFALEKNPARITKIENNARRLGVANYRVIAQAAPAGLNELLPPDRVFVGGGGEDLKAILSRSYGVLKAGGRMVVSAVTREALAVITAFRPERKLETVQIAVSRETELARKYHFMKNENQVIISVFKK